MKIYSPADIELLDTLVSDTSYRYRAIMGENNLTLNFSSAEFIEIPIGSYCTFEGQTYTLESPENFKKKGTRNFEYTLVLESPYAKLKRYKFRNPVDKRLKFDLTAKPVEHLQMLVDNLNLRDSGWSVGSYVDSVEKVISYNHTYCSEVLQMLADEFETEWEIVGKVLNLRKVEYNKETPLALAYGKGNGFRPGVGRVNYSDSKPVEILFVQGGERNINFSTYGSRELLLPISQTLVYEGRTYVTDAEGLSIRRQDKAVVYNNEDSLDCSHIYPSRVGAISSVVAADPDSNFYDIIDSSIPEDLDFSQHRTDGEVITIIFQSGMLAGKEFEIEQTDTLVTGYIHSERRFNIVPQEIDGQTMPNATFIPAIGDTYAVFGISLPDAYVCDNTGQTGASWDMFREGVKFLYENEDQKFSFTGELDGIWAKTNWATIGGKIKPGGYVSFSDAQAQTESVLIRIVGVKDYVNKPHYPEIELSNATIASNITSSLRKIDSNEVVAESLHKDSVQYTKRRYRDAKETIGLVENSLLHYSQSIDPISVQTMALLIGDISLQYRFVNNTTNPETVSYDITYNAENKKLLAGAGIIQHMTLGIENISSSHSASEYRFWNVSAFESVELTDAAKSYYIYIKASRTTAEATFILNETAIEMESDSNYYHFWFGILNSEFEGDRSFAEMYGFSEFLPGRITTKKIISPDGNSYFDLETGEFKGIFKFTSGSNVQTEVDNAASAASTAQSAANNAQSSASAALSQISFIVSDNILSAAEKPSQKQAWDVIYPEKSVLDGQATTYGVTTEKTNYDNAFQALANYLNNGYSWYSGTPAWLAAIDTDTVITGTTYRYYWSELYAKRTDLLNAIYARIKALSTSEANSYTDSIKDLLQSQIDGQIISWFQEYDPTTLNYPASEWTTDTLKLQHANDTFTNTLSGGCWRWQQSGSVWGWGIISDTATQQALAAAATAQDTADGKRRVFVATPTSSNAYDIGDLWVNATYGSYSNDLLKCITAKVAGASFNIAHWGLASAYDNTQTTIDGGLVTTGTLQAVNGGSVAAGVTGVDSGDSAVRFWAGATFANRATAPFRVLQDGSFVASKATISSSTSGKRILIDSANNVMILYDASGNETARIDDDVDSDWVGTPLGGLKALNPSNGKVTYVTANGVFNNGSGVKFLPGTSGITTNANLVGLLQERNSDSNGISAAIVGIDQTAYGNSMGLAAYYIGRILHIGLNSSKSYGFTDESINQVSNNATVYLSSSYSVFIGNLKTQDSTWYLPNPANYKKWECIEIICYNDRNIYLKPLSGDYINGYTSTQKYITMHDASCCCTLMSNGVDNWLIKSIGGTSYAF